MLALVVVVGWKGKGEGKDGSAEWVFGSGRVEISVSRGSTQRGKEGERSGRDSIRRRGGKDKRWRTRRHDCDLRPLQLNIWVRAIEQNQIITSKREKARLFVVVWRGKGKKRRGE